jgi:tetratricopeptide repeat protein
LAEKALGPKHPATAGIDRLAHFFTRQGDLAAARRLLERVVAINERTGHWKLVQSLSHLSTVLEAQGDLAGARRVIEREVASTKKPSEPKVS